MWSGEWTEIVDWTGRLDWKTGLGDWTGEWTGRMDWESGLRE